MKENTDAVIPLVQEKLEIGTERVETGKVRIRTVVDERLERVAQDLEEEVVSVERVPVNRQVTHPPEVREADGVLIVPVMEEVLVVEKRLVVKEELHIRRQRRSERFEEAVRLRGMRAEVERVDAALPPTPQAEPGARRRPRLRRKELPEPGRS